MIRLLILQFHWVSCCLLIGVLQLGVPASELTEHDLVVASGYEVPRLLADFSDERLPESSGLICGRRNLDVLWTINDHGNQPIVHAFDRRGFYRGGFKLKNRVNVDWEAISACRIEGKDYLVIADVGDNFAVRPLCTLYIVEEPLLDEREIVEGLLPPIAPAWHIHFSYPDGARDCEAIAIDEKAELVYLISKRDVPVRFYSLPLRPAQTGNQVATNIGTIPFIPQPTAQDIEEHMDYGKDRAQVTDMAFDEAHQVVALNTYKNIYVFKRGEAMTWTEALQQKPSVLKRAQLNQSEGICFDLQGNLLFNSEQVPWPLFEIKRKDL